LTTASIQIIMFRRAVSFATRHPFVARAAGFGAFTISTAAGCSTDTANKDETTAKVALPPDWGHAYSAEGHVFYFNKVTGETSWDVPKSQKWVTTWDARPKNKHGAVHQIVLVRHGQYEENQETDFEQKLTELGRKQSIATGKRINELVSKGVLSPIKMVYYSTMTRATETAEHIISQLPEGIRKEPCSMIREAAVCRPDPPSRSWVVTDEEFEKEGLRVRAAFSSHFHRADEGEEKGYTTVLVCHGNVIRYLVLRALQLDPQAWLRTAVYNGSITILEIRADGGVSLRALGDCGHLPPEMITYSLTK
jgi:serine/threonine-protein phosphatase PGAM5